MYVELDCPKGWLILFCVLAVLPPITLISLCRNSNSIGNNGHSSKEESCDFVVFGHVGE